MVLEIHFTNDARYHCNLPKTPIIGDKLIFSKDCKLCWQKHIQPYCDNKKYTRHQNRSMKFTGDLVKDYLD